MKKPLAVLVISAVVLMSPSVAMATSREAKSRPPQNNTLAQLHAAFDVTSSGALTNSNGDSCGDGSADDNVVQFTATIHNLTAKRILAIRAVVTWSFVDVYQAYRSYSVEWDQQQTVRPHGVHTVPQVDETLDCNNNADYEVQNNGGGKFSWVPLEVVFTDGTRIGPPPTVAEF